MIFTSFSLNDLSTKSVNKLQNEKNAENNPFEVVLLRQNLVLSRSILAFGHIHGLRNYYCFKECNFYLVKKNATYGETKLMN